MSGVEAEFDGVGDHRDELAAQPGNGQERRREGSAGEEEQ